MYKRGFGLKWMLSGSRPPVDMQVLLDRPCPESSRWYLEKVLLLKELRPLLGVQAAAQADKGNIVTWGGSGR